MLVHALLVFGNTVKYEKLRHPTPIDGKRNFKIRLPYSSLPSIELSGHSIRVARKVNVHAASSYLVIQELSPPPHDLGERPKTEFPDFTSSVDKHSLSPMGA